MSMIRLAELHELDKIISIYQQAREFMAENGNPTQWGNGYPSRELLENDIAKKQLHVIMHDGNIDGVFVFIIGKDSTYDYIESGKWLNDRPYGTIHRIAGAGTGKGSFGECFKFCKKQITNIRIDTHADNIIMQHIVEKYGFEKCGIIYVEDESARIAYQYTKPLEEMSLEELWHLFPIELVPYNPQWKDWYKEEAALLKSKIPPTKIKGIYHIGSTAISGIMAKPIVDILIEGEEGADIEQIAACIEKCGYIRMSDEQDRISFNKGYTTAGFAEKVFHIHLRRQGDTEEIFFRDYLINNRSKAREYETLKIAIQKKYEFDRDSYTEAKSDFVNEISAMRFA